MVENLFLELLQISVTMIPVILLLRLLGDRLQRRYVARWKYYIWLVLAVRLLVPWTPALSVQPLEITLPVNEEILLEERVTSKVPAQVLDVQVPIVQIESTSSQEREIIYEASQAEHADTGAAVRRPNMLAVVTVLWFAVAALSLGYHIIVNSFAGRRLRRWSHPADKELSAKLQQALGEEVLPRKLEVLVNPQLAGPMVMGLVRPVLYLPQTEYQREELRLVLRHELTHYKRRDLWYKAFLLLVNCVHWFNPFVYLMYREAEKDLECSCDSRVMEDVERTGRCHYAHLILDTAAGQGTRGRLFTSNFRGGAEDMKRRLQNIMDAKKKRHGILTFFILVIVSVGAGSLVGFKLGQKDGEQKALQEMSHKEAVEEVAVQDTPVYDVTIYPERLSPDKELVGENKFESPIDFLNQHMEQRVDKSGETTYITLGKKDYGRVSAYRREGVSQTFYELEYGNNLYDDIHYNVKDNTLICEVGLYQGQTLCRGKAILTYCLENGEYVIDEDTAVLELDRASDVTAGNSLWRHSQIMEEVDGLQLTAMGNGEDYLTLHRAVYGKDAYNVLTVYLSNGLIADYKFPSNSPIVNDISHIYHLPMQSDFYQTLILTLSDPELQSTDESTDHYIFHVEMNEEETQAEIVLDAVILDNGTKSGNYEMYKDIYLEMPFYHVISDMEAGPHYHEELGVATLQVVGMPYERKVKQYAYVYWDGEGWKTYFE